MIQEGAAKNGKKDTTKKGKASEDLSHIYADYDVILTTYAVLESSFRKQHVGFNRKTGKVFEDSLLHKTHWGRIILDEAHCIKDRSCSTARAAFALNSDMKWSLSGTPVGMHARFPA